MTSLILKLCGCADIDENTADKKMRGRLGVISAAAGMICNMILFALKFAVGTVSNSVSVISDAFNNLSDCATCIVSLLGFKMAEKPADKEHPFGHGRMEYLTALVLAAAIIAVGLELLKSSVGRIISPQQAQASIPIILSLLLSAGVKLWMSIFNTRLGRLADSPVILAAAKDSRTDVIATAAAAGGLLISAFTGLDAADGVTGTAVSLFVLYSGYSLVRDTVDQLLGKPADDKLAEEIKRIANDCDKVIGIHDLIIHDYGPGNLIGSCHLEAKSSESFADVHEAADRIERNILSLLGVRMTVHMDPVDLDNEQTAEYFELIKDIAASLDERLSIHDFRMIAGEDHKSAVFDLAAPYECSYTDEQMKFYIDSELEKRGKDIYTVITFDRK